MKKRIPFIPLFLLLFLPLCSCSAIGSKSASMVIIYGATAVLALLLLVGYCLLVRRRETWFLLLFFCILIVNTGYLALSVSKTLEEALLANRIAYCGSVFLPMSMLMIILKTTKFQYRKWLPLTLLAVAMVVFAIAATPGYLDIYYKSVALGHVCGVTVLLKEYGSWHWIYLAYLLSYFAATIAAIFCAAAKRRIESAPQTAMLFAAVFVNIGVWLLEQLVQIDFEFLSVSYIICELFLLGLCLLEQETLTLPQPAPLPAAPLSPEEPASTSAEEPETEKVEADALAEHCGRFTAGLPTLTHTERMIYQFYIDGRTTKEIMSELDIKENTLKYHNKNLYSKLGVSSRKQLMEIARTLHLSDENRDDSPH